MSAEETRYASLNSQELMRLERQIAKRYAGKFPWFMLAWALINTAIWLSLWPLVLLDMLPLWAAFPVAVINITLVYLPTHDAQHDIFAKPGQPLRWLNELIGHGTTWIMVAPFEVLRQTHLDHHRYANDPERDPDFETSAENGWHAIWKSVQNRQSGGKRIRAYMDCLERLGRQDLVTQAAAYNIGFLGLLCILAWAGYGLEAFFLWWFPLKIAMVYIDFFLSWAPHYPAKETGRYRDTRAFKSRLGNVLSLGMQYHIVHHLHPNIPLHLNPDAYWEMRPVLVARGCRIDGL